jgi:cell volume regulation protein A
VSNGQLILIAGSLLAAGLVASLMAFRMRVPALLLFLGLGMLAGSDVTGWIYFDDYELARTVGVIALSLILFEGGLAAGFQEIRPVLRPAISLASAGTILTALITGFAAGLLFDFSTVEGLLLGSILAATDSAAIFSVLRGSTLRRRLARTLEGEAGINDPIAVLLVLGFIDWIEKPGYGLPDMIGLFASQLAIGAALGLAVGWLAAQFFRRARLTSVGLYPVASLTAAALAFGAADTLGGSGFLSVYLTGLFLGSVQIPARRTVAAFHDGLAWVAQLSMFFVLGLLVFPSEFGGVALKGTILALLLVFVARPLATFLATAPERFTTGERIALGWGGLRGAVPVVLATFPVIDGVPGSGEFFNIVFFAVLLSTLVQGSTFESLARALRVTTSEPALPRPLAESGVIRGLGAEVVEFPVSASDAIVGHRVRDLGLPREALVTVIVREDRAIPPRGSTVINAGDRLHILVTSKAAGTFPALIDVWQTGPVPGGARPYDEVWVTVPVYRARRSDESG